MNSRLKTGLCGPAAPAVSIRKLTAGLVRRNERAPCDLPSVDLRGLAISANRIRFSNGSKQITINQKDSYACSSNSSFLQGLTASSPVHLPSQPLVAALHQRRGASQSRQQ